jgi:hypothetical protein
MANKTLFRAHSMGDIMTGVKKGWDVENSITCKRRLVQMYRELMWQRKYNKSNKYTEKGNMVEQDAITLYSRFIKEHLIKNSTRLNNEFFSGEIDVFKGPEILRTKHTIDVKSSWDWMTFPSIVDSIKDYPDYDYQGQVYMHLCGAEKHTVVHCLLNTPANLITAAKRRLAWEMDIIIDGIESPEYIEACIEIEKNSIFDMALFRKHFPYFEFHCKDWHYDIPFEKRVHEMIVIRDDKKIESMIERVKECREWMDTHLWSQHKLLT